MKNVNPLQTARRIEQRVAKLGPNPKCFYCHESDIACLELDHPNCLIADEMGLGKTVEAIGLSNSCPAIKKVLIVCPASLKLNWLREWLRWDTKSRSVGIVTGDRHSQTEDCDYCAETN